MASKQERKKLNCLYVQIQCGKSSLFNNDIGESRQQCAKKKNTPGPLFYIIHENEPKWIKDTNLRSENIKLLEENIVDKLFDVGLGNVFKILIPKTKTTKAKINKQNYVKLKHLSPLMKIINKMKGQLMECDEMFANHVSYKQLMPPKYKNLIQINNKISKQSN